MIGGDRSMAGGDGSMADATPSPEEIRERYRLERAKRLRPDGPAQYIEPTGRFASLLGDPYTPRVERAPRHDEAEAVVVGGGFAGLSAGARLKEAGIDDVVIVEGGGDFGGVWYWNRYPGAMCDTAAMVYLPFLEETGHRPSAKYVSGREIHDHAKRIGATFGLYDAALFSTAVTGLTWDGAIARWRVATDRGDELLARFVAMGTGPMHRPKLPGIEGIEDFAGHAFHTSRWDYAYTGGDRTGRRMERLADKRVGIIGTGATAVQCVPHLAASAGELLVFQRTPSSIDVRANRPLRDDDFNGLGRRWQRDWLRNFATLQTGASADVDLVMDGWTDIAKRIRDRVIALLSADGDADFAEVVNRAFEEADDEKMNEIRARVDSIVADAGTADALKPWYRQLCKRPCFHDEYLQAYNRPNTRLIDTDGKGVERIDATGVWAAGEHFELDCLIFASGFEVNLVHTADYETRGRGGRLLSEHWADGMRSLHGIQVHGFPNLFIVGLAQGANLVSNVTHNFTEAGTAIAAVVSHCVEHDLTTVEPTREAEEAWVSLVENQDRQFLADCTPGYYNNEGKAPTERDRRNSARFPAGPVAFFDHLSDWARSGEFAGLRFGPRLSGSPGPRPGTAG